MISSTFRCSGKQSCVGRSAPQENKPSGWRGRISLNNPKACETQPPRTGESLLRITIRVTNICASSLARRPPFSKLNRGDQQVSRGSDGATAPRTWCRLPRYAMYNYRIHQSCDATCSIFLRTAVYSYHLGCDNLRTEGSGEPTLLECNCIFVRERRARQWLKSASFQCRVTVSLCLDSLVPAAGPLPSVYAAICFHSTKRRTLSVAVHVPQLIRPRLCKLSALSTLHNCPKCCHDVKESTSLDHAYLDHAGVLQLLPLGQ
jgi:hypothetical protein